MTEPRLTIAIQKKGRLTKASRDLFERAGVDMPDGGDQLLVRSKTMPIDFVMLRPDDIPVFLNSGMCDMGIVGENTVKEFNRGMGDSANIKTLKRLGTATCRLALAVPEGSAFKSLNDFEGARIATSFPNILKQFMDAKGIMTRILPMTGSVEVAPAMGAADAICDLVETGSTLKANRLVEFGDVMKSEAVLLRTSRRLSPEQEAIIANLMERIDRPKDAPKTREPVVPATAQRSQLQVAAM